MVSKQARDALIHGGEGVAEDEANLAIVAEQKELGRFEGCDAIPVSGKVRQVIEGKQLPVVVAA